MGTTDRDSQGWGRWIVLCTPFFFSWRDRAARGSVATAQSPIQSCAHVSLQLVPQFCEYWYEQVQRGGASSLNSGNVSLQLSDSFNLFELIEQYHMQTD